jgi:hypothetical protein
LRKKEKKGTRCFSHLGRHTLLGHALLLTLVRTRKISCAYFLLITNGSGTVVCVCRDADEMVFIDPSWAWWLVEKSSLRTGRIPRVELFGIATQNGW